MSRELSLEISQSTASPSMEEAKAAAAAPETIQEDEAQEESASNVLRRLSSPIFGATGFNSDSEDNGHSDGDFNNTNESRGDGDGSDDEEETERKEGAAEVVQRWWRECRRASKRTRAVVAARPAFVRIQQLFDKLDAGQMSFERTGLALQNPDIQRAVTKALSAVPRDDALLAMPKASRSTRAILSSLMIVYHPGEVLTAEGDDDDSGDGGAAAAATTSSSSTTPPSPTRLGSAAEPTPVEGVAPTKKKLDPVAAALRNASALLLASVKAITAALGPVVSGEKGARKTLAVRVGVLRLCRKYFAVSLAAWKDKDAQRVAAQVVQPYARAYAMRLAAVAQGDERVAEMVKGQLGQYRRALEHLIGPERASNSLQEVELAVQADLREQMPPSTPPPPSSSSPPAATAVAGVAAAAATTATPLSKNETNSTTTNAKNSATVGDVTGAGSASKTAGPVPAAAAAAAAAAGVAPASAGRGGDYRLPDGRLGRLLGNEQLAHEILVNPDFQIPAIEEDDPRNSTASSSSSSSPEEELARRFKDVMRRIFWDRFTQSLLPPPDPTPAAAAAAAAAAASSADAPAGAASNTATTAAAGEGGGTEAVVHVTGLPPLRAGSKVHARYGSERGSYYAATVVAVGSSSDVPSGVGDGQVAGGGGGVFVDVRYDEDGMVERGVPASRLKKRDDPPDFGPLLALLGEVREELVSLTPNNSVLVGEVRAVLSQERLAEMLRDKTLDARQVQRLVGFIAGRILNLQAPVRSDGARAWLKGFDASMEAAIASGDPLAIIPLLPRVFEFVFAQMEEIKRDTANAHIRLIAPYLARHGAPYERAKFEARLSSGDVSLERTKAWLSSAVQGFLGGDAGEGAAGDEGERARRAKGLRDGREELHKAVLQEAFIGLLRSTVRLDRPDAAAAAAGGVLPETLAGDGGRLAAARDDVDRVTLVATLCVLVRQVLARLRIGCPAPAMAALQAKTSGLLKQQGVLLPQIVEECVATSRRLASSASKEGGGAAESPPGLPPAEEEGLRSLLMSSADPNNEVFRVFFKRVLLSLKGMVAGGDAADVCVHNGMQSFVEELRPVGARLHRLFAHNVKVFAGHYGPIVTEAATAFALS